MCMGQKNVKRNYKTKISILKAKTIFSTLFLIICAASVAQFQGPTYADTYYSVIDVAYRSQWGPYNVHDPSVIKDSSWYYMFSTDNMVAYSPPPITGIQVRRSQDLITWEFVGFAFDGVPQEAIDHITANGETCDNIWAPYITKHDSTYRLYWCVSSFGTKVSYLGLATGTSLDGPWTQQGCVVKTTGSDGMNAIDPTVVKGKNGEQYLAYGSHFGGLYMKPLDESTGLAEDVDDKGWLIARRATSRLEAPEITYNPETDYYYLFVSYDDLLDKYNVRVGRSDTVTGPFYDINGVDMSANSNNYPLILHPYKFKGHAGWQGTGHCAVINDDGQFYIIHQGRPVVDIYMMVCHVRKIQWIDGWPVVSPERYGGVPYEGAPAADSIPRFWEHLTLRYTPEFTLSESSVIQLYEDGTISGNPTDTWSYSDSSLSLIWSNGLFIDTCKVWYEWDWEKKMVCMVYSGLRNTDVGIWGKSLGKDYVSGFYDNLNSKSADIKIYPNPSPDGQFSIGINGLSDNNIVINIYNSLGKLVYKAPVTDAMSHKADVSLESGFYIISIKGSDIDFRQKLIVK